MINDLRRKHKFINKALLSISHSTHIGNSLTQTQQLQTNDHPHLSQKLQISIHHSRRFNRLQPSLQTIQNSQFKSKQMQNHRSLNIDHDSKLIKQQKNMASFYQTQQKKYHPSRKKRSLQHLYRIKTQNSLHLMQGNTASRNILLLKQNATELIQRGQYLLCLDVLNSAAQLNKMGIIFLQLKAFCFIKLKQFQRALQILKKVIIFDRRNKKAYIWSSVCEMQLKDNKKSNLYLEECIRLFPADYQAYYLKANLLINKKSFHKALQFLLKAYQLNSNKAEIALQIANCLEQTGDAIGSLSQYQQLITEVTPKNHYFAARYAYLLAKLERYQQSEKIIQKCLLVSQNNRQYKLQNLLHECQYRIAVNHFIKCQYQLCLTKSQELLKKGKSRWFSEITKMIVSVKIALKQFYGAAILAQRMQLLDCKIELGQVGVFCQGTMLLMRNKTLEALQKLQKCQKLIEIGVNNHLAGPIHKIIHLFLFHAYFLSFNYSQALVHIKKQKRLGLDSIYGALAAYNEAIAQGYIAYYSNNLDEASVCFKNALAHNFKPDVFLYLSVTLFHKLEDKDAQKELLMYLDKGCSQLASFKSNLAAYAFYYRALYKASKQEYSCCIEDLETGIDKSQQHTVKFLYLKALVLSLMQNYKQAISEASTALSIAKNDIRCYELRARCFQIDGNPTQAFADVQNFIQIKPADKQIHKLAGHLLFENGAFQEALLAFSKTQVFADDSQVFLTKSKTFFLLGRFAEASHQMELAAKSFTDSPSMLFDSKLMSWLADLLPPHNINEQNINQVEQQSDYSFDQSHLQSALQKLTTIYKKESQTEQFYGVIFRLPQLYTLSGLCKFYLRQYRSAVDFFVDSLSEKVGNFQKDNQGDYEQQQAEKLIFVNQMYFNIAVCFCLLQDFKNAQKYLSSCQIDQESQNYSIYQQLMHQIQGTNPHTESGDYLELFSTKNKISRFLPTSQISFKSQLNSTVRVRRVKLCIPYPKVQPPNINPQFDTSLLQQVSLDNFEGRPQAPWIIKENNVIKFTEKIQAYSRLSLGESSVDEAEKQEMRPGQLSLQLQIMNDLKLDVSFKEQSKKIKTM